MAAASMANPKGTVHFSHGGAESESAGCLLSVIIFQRSRTERAVRVGGDPDGIFAQPAQSKSIVWMHQKFEGLDAECDGCFVHGIPFVGLLAVHEMRRLALVPPGAPLQLGLGRSEGENPLAEEPVIGGGNGHSSIIETRRIRVVYTK